MRIQRLEHPAMVRASAGLAARLAKRAIDAFDDVAVAGIVRLDERRDAREVATEARRWHVDQFPWVEVVTIGVVIHTNTVRGRWCWPCRYRCRAWRLRGLWCRCWPYEQHGRFRRWYCGR